MQNLNVEPHAEAPVVAETEERLTWERPALRRVGASQAEYAPGPFYSFDGMYYS